MPNIVDIIVIAVLAAMAFLGFRRGLLRMVYRLVSFAIAIFLAVQLYPVAGDLLRRTPMYEGLQGVISENLNLEGHFRAHQPSGSDAVAAQEWQRLVDSLPLPQGVRDRLYEQALPDVGAWLQLDTWEENIAGFFADIVINALAVLLVFLVVILLLSLGGMALDIVGRLPVIHTLNSVGGLAVGLLLGGAVVWLGLTFMMMLFAANPASDMYALLHGSWLAQWLGVVVRYG